jgi:hypothetical protein
MEVAPLVLGSIAAVAGYGLWSGKTSLVLLAGGALALLILVLDTPSKIPLTQP